MRKMIVIHIKAHATGLETNIDIRTIDILELMKKTRRQTTREPKASHDKRNIGTFKI